MADSNIVSLIKNLIAEQTSSNKVVQQLELINDTESNVIPSINTGTNNNGGQVDPSTPQFPLYEWSPPQLPSIQIQPFTPKDIATPSNLMLVSQNIELSADGGITVTAVISCDDVLGAAEYEFRLSSS
jgi:hypothetical protein